MIESKITERICSCYQQYCGVIKPLIAQIEATSEKIPLQLFNEIRAFNDHLARCYYNNPAEEYIHEQIDKAERHIVRMTLDCFKCLNVIQYQKIELFEAQTRDIDLTVIDNGTFYPKYSRLKIEAAQMVREAKISEAIDTDKALEFYQKGFNLYSMVVADIDKITEKVKWAKVRFKRRRWLTIICWICSVVISAIVSAIFSNEIVTLF